MSWITDLAGKAENVLIKFDTSAATILTEPTHEKENGSINESYSKSSAGTTNYLQSSSSVPKNLSGLSSEIIDLQAPTSMSESYHENVSFGNSPRKSKNKIGTKSTDQSLINFLNAGQSKSSINSETEVDSTMQPGNENSPSNLVHSRQSSISSGSSSFLAVSGRDTPAFTSLDIESSTGSGGSGGSDPYVTLETPTEAITVQGSSETPKKKKESYQSSSSQETAFLRKEVSSLNQEMTQMLKRVKEADRESQRMKDKVSTINLQLKQSESLMRDMQENETKLQRLLKEKEEVLASMKVKLNDVDQKVQERDRASKELQEQNQRLLEGANMSNNLHSEVVVSLQEKLKDTEAKLKRETDILTLTREESTNRVMQLEEDQKTITRDLSDLNRKLQDERSKSTSFNSQLSSMKSELSLAREELEDYKSKASRILQSKEKLIASLKEGNGDSSQDEFLKEEIDQVKNERDLLREELTRSSQRIQQLTGDVAEAEALADQESKSAEQQMSQLQEDLSREHSEANFAQDELKQAKQELRCVQEELTRQKVNVSSRLQERDEEIHRLQKQIAHKQSSSTGITELENRIHGLTESLILKQTSIESLSTDKHTLQIQLEKIQQQYQESQKMLNKDSVIELSPEEVRSRGVPNFMLESPFDGGVARRVKKAYGTLDKFSIRLGIFLRRYPIARVFVIIYMGLLHAWVMIVLLTYTPEIHGLEYKHPVNYGTAPRVPHQ